MRVGLAAAVALAVLLPSSRASAHVPHNDMLAGAFDAADTAEGERLNAAGDAIDTSTQ